MNWHWIEAGALAAGSIPRFEREVRQLHDSGVRAIVTLTSVPLAIFHRPAPELLAELDILGFHYPIRDDHPPEREQAREILATLRALREAARPVYLHCRAGMGRTGTILHLYYVAQGLSFADAYERIAARRFLSTRLKPRQEAFVRAFEAELKQELSTDLDHGLHG